MSNKPRCKDIAELVSEFCSIILTEKDDLNITDAKSYIDSLKDFDRELLVSADFNSPIIVCIVKNSLNNYILKYQNVDYSSKRNASPFEFDNGDNFLNYQKNLKNYICLMMKQTSFLKYFMIFFVI